MKDIVKFSSVKKPRGIVKIELFDDITKKKIQEIRGENFVSQGVLRTWAKYRVIDLFTRTASTKKFNIDPPDMFKCIRLTDASHPEDPLNEWFPRGVEIGYALTDSPYSGSDTKRGTINTAETTVTFKQIHFVFDFPTHAGNGTFQSIYFTPETNSFLRAIGTGKYIRTNSPFVDLGESFISGYFISPGSSSGTSTFYEYDKKTLNEIRSWQFTHNSSLTQFGGFAVKDGYIYYLYQISNRMVVARAPLSDPNNLSTVVTLERNLFSYSSFGPFLYLKDKRQWLVYARFSGNSNYTATLYDENWNILTEMPNLKPTAYYDGVLFTEFEGRYLEPGVTDFSQLFSYGLLETYDSKIVMVDDNFIYRHKNYSDNAYELYLSPRACIGSRCLLDQPVTKTSTNIMKITYDFILEP